ncbi:MAG: succinylglutamate desuccinylase, partial [Candidatus Puniceispirillaceae bacterium]
MRWSDDANPLGVYPVPIACIVGKPGPTALLVAGVHGDEFEGPVALCRLIDEITPEQLEGRLIVLPAVNYPAVIASQRTSPLDSRNMNRAFPGDPDGGPTDMLADFIVSVLLPEADLVVDLHAGGKASVFATSALATRIDNQELMQANLDLAAAFGAPLTWILGGFNDTRSLNSAALNAGVPMVAV